MKTAYSAIFIGVAAASLAGTTGQTSAEPAGRTNAQTKIQSAALSIADEEITKAVRGKTCTTTQGAKFTFTKDGHYAYEGYWTNSGHYAIGNGAISVMLDNGLERSFVISRKGDAFYMEKTVITCD